MSRFGRMIERCENCWWFWSSIYGEECHHKNATREDRLGDGRECPWFDAKDELKRNEQELPPDIWN